MTIGTETFCTPKARTSRKHGKLPADFWFFVDVKHGKDAKVHRFAQSMHSQRIFVKYWFVSHFDFAVTGCMKPDAGSTFNHLNVQDTGGRYDGGHPPGSTCVGFKHYVQVSHRFIFYSEVYSTSQARSLTRTAVLLASSVVIIPTVVPLPRIPARRVRVISLQIIMSDWHFAHR